MLPPHLRKFSELHTSYGLGAVKNVWLLTCLIPLARTVNLYKMKDYVGGVLGKEDTRPESHYKRLIRFFQDWGQREDLLHDLMRQNLRFLRGLGFKMLALDGTSWTIGETKVHYLVLSVLVNNVAVPIYWVQLGKLGASSQKERKAMFKKALSLFDLKGMTLLADREYVGKDWFKFLKNSKINFVIRLKFADYYLQVDATKGKNYQAMYNKCLYKGRLVKKQIFLDNLAYWMVMIPNPKPDADEGVILFLTTLPPTRKTAGLYAKRWKIESLFLHLKSNGFNLEDLNLKDPDKNRLFLAIIATAYILALREGWKRRKQISTQHYKDGTQTMEVSIFRKGLAILTSKCFRFIDFLRYLLDLFSPINHPICKNVQ